MPTNDEKIRQAEEMIAKFYEQKESLKNVDEQLHSAEMKVVRLKRRKNDLRLRMVFYEAKLSNLIADIRGNPALREKVQKILNRK